MPLAQREATHNSDDKSQEIETDRSFAGVEVVNMIFKYVLSVLKLSPGAEVSMKH